MGCCSASPDRLMDREVNKEIEGDRNRISKIQKLLFLGSGGSGKSTFFKQLRVIHGAGFSDKDRKVFKEHISAQIIEQMNRCVECISYYNEELSPYEPLRLSSQGENSAKYMDELMSAEHLVDEEIAKHVETLWNEDAIQEIYKNRALYHIDDSSSYFFDAISRIGDNEYLPTNQDILYVRYRTTGVIESEFRLQGSNFHIFDVGGQQSERKKWIHCFENVTAVIFVASLSCYDEIMFEDESTNCMIDSLELFREICNLQWFVTTPIILFLNKQDLFETKICITPLSVCFQEFGTKPPEHIATMTPDTKDSGGDETNNLLTDEMQAEKDKYMLKARDFIKDRFIAYSGTGQHTTRQVYTHITTATDKSNVQNVFNDVQQIVVSNGLERNNLL